MVGGSECSENGSTLGTIINWANHPETLWSKNLLISSDFPHCVREALEKGVYDGDKLMYKELVEIIRILD